MLICGVTGALIGRALSGFVDDFGLESRLGMLGAFDGLGIVGLLHRRLIQSEESERSQGVIGAFMMFVLVGLKLGHGHGVTWMFAFGFLNGLVALLLALAVLKSVPRARGRPAEASDDAG